ncbi:hypothetical protein [Streptomyces sp. NPDC057580]|uniref:hypothetical protein n=1 Tax=Streptomyces sp. NPDC057580 TaxID=3346173 RepID=UPI00368F5508
MKTPTPEQARDALAAAEAEKTEAEELAAAVAEKVRAGDDTVTPKDLTAARELAEFADLRITAARRKLATAEEADRHARAEAVAADVRALVENDDPDDIAAKTAAAVDALAALHAATEARRLRVLEMAGRVHPIANELEVAGFHPVTELRKRYAIGADHDSVAIYNPEPLGTVAVAPALAIAAAVGIAVRDNGEQAKISDQMSYLSSRVEAFVRQVPALRAIFNEDGSAK